MLEDLEFERLPWATFHDENGHVGHSILLCHNREVMRYRDLIGFRSKRKSALLDEAISTYSRLPIRIPKELVARVKELYDLHTPYEKIGQGSEVMRLAGITEPMSYEKVRGILKRRGLTRSERGGNMSRRSGRAGNKSTTRKDQKNG